MVGGRGAHVEGSAHYDHRAIDVQAFGNTPVGYNPVTWEAIMYAIATRQFTRIGTIPEIANNPIAQAFARAMGTNLFVDVGLDPAHPNRHVHYQVGP